MKINFSGESAMTENIDRKYSRRLGPVAMAVVAIAAAFPAAYARASSIVVVPPTDLPELARHGGEAMFLHDTVDGRTLLYVEHNQGAGLAILDVTDPGHIKSEGAVALDAPGPFDFVSAFGDQAELVRYRQDQASAVLDLHKLNFPTLMALQWQASQGPTAPAGEDGFDTANSQLLRGVTDVTRVTGEIANTDTGTTFLLTERGLYVVRRPNVEMIKQLRESNYAN
jgi:hypothetical protein